MLAWVFAGACLILLTSRQLGGRDRFSRVEGELVGTCAYTNYDPSPMRNHNDQSSNAVASSPRP